MEQTSFTHWAIVELFGHARIAGLVTEQQIGGASFIRVDVPELQVRARDARLPGPITVETRPAYTRIFGAAAIYAITPVNEEIARLAAEDIGGNPINVWLPTLHRALGAKAGEAPGLPPDPDEEPDLGEDGDQEDEG